MQSRVHTNQKAVTGIPRASTSYGTDLADYYTTRKPGGRRTPRCSPAPRPPRPALECRHHPLRPAVRSPVAPDPRQPPRHPGDDRPAEVGRTRLCRREHRTVRQPSTETAPPSASSVRGQDSGPSERTLRTPADKRPRLWARLRVLTLASLAAPSHCEGQAAVRHANLTWPP